MHQVVKHLCREVLCRTGFRGAGQTRTIRYGANAAHPTEKSAVHEANKWLIAERVRQGY